VRLNRNRVSKTGQAVKAGDVLTLTLYSGVRVIRVLQVAERRGPATEARLLYEDIPEKTGPQNAGQQNQSA
jgi:ribosome-associated heat shock protein Hsp15